MKWGSFDLNPNKVFSGRVAVICLVATLVIATLISFGILH